MTTSSDPLEAAKSLAASLHSTPRDEMPCDGSVIRQSAAGSCVGVADGPDLVIRSTYRDVRDDQYESYLRPRPSRPGDVLTLRDGRRVVVVREGDDDGTPFFAARWVRYAVVVQDAPVVLARLEREAATKRLALERREDQLTWSEGDMVSLQGARVAGPWVVDGARGAVETARERRDAARAALAQTLAQIEALRASVRDQAPARA